MPADRPASQAKPHDNGADGRGAPEDAEALGAGVQDVAREDRQQGGDAGEDHDKQVQRDRPQKDRVGAYIGQAREGARPHPAPTARTQDRARLDGLRQDDSRQLKRGGEDEGPGPHPGIGQAAQSRPGHDRQLIGRGAERHRLADLLGRHQGGEQGLLGRHAERAARADQEHQRVEPAHAEPRLVESEQRHRRHDLRDQIGRDHPSPVVAVGDVAGDAHQGDGRKELEQGDKAQRIGAVRALIDHPAQGRGRHLHGHAAQHAGGDKTEEVGALAQHRPDSP